MRKSTLDAYGSPRTPPRARLQWAEEIDTTERNGVIGRNAELAEGEWFLDALADGPVALVVGGEAGIGKSAIWDELAERSRDRGYEVLACRPSEAETKLSLVGLADLFGDVADTVLPVLPPPQRQAMEVALLRAEPDGYVADWRAVGTGLRSALAQLAKPVPVVLAIDDVQWLDRPTTRVLEFALRRLATLPIGVLVAARTPDHAVVRLSLDRALPQGRVRELELGPLSLGSLYQLLRARLGARVPRPMLLRIEEASGGNPFYALEIARELIRTGASASPIEPLPLPRSLSDLSISRIRRLPAETQEALLAVAAASHPTFELVASAQGGDEAAARSLARAEQAGVIKVAGEHIAFAHPLLASAAYAHAPRDARRRAHRRLAGAVHDPEERARHLALATTRRDERVAAALVEAADRLAARGAPEEAAELCELAVERTPFRLGDERYARLLDAARLHDMAGAHDRAREILDGLIDELPPGPMRGEAALILAKALEGDLERMVQVVDNALDERSIDDGLRARLLAQLAEARFRRGHARDALDPARRGLALADASGDTRTVLSLAAHLATVEFWSGERGPEALLDDGGGGVLRQWVALERRSGPGLAFADSPRAALATRLVHLGAMDEARELFLETLEDVEARGDERSRVRALWHLAQLEDYSGNWQRAEQLVEQAAELEEQLGLESGAVYFARAGHAAVLGRIPETERLVAEGVARAREAGDTPYELLTLGVLGFLRFSLGDAEGAAAVLRPIIERALEISEPRVNRYWPDTIEALVATGDLELGWRYLELYASEAARLGVPRSLARVAHCRGVLHAASGEQDAALAAFADSLTIHERCPNVFEHARTLLALGMAQRRFKQRRSAQASIGQALTIFESLPSPLWAERASAELARTGVRRRDGEHLTETESQVARLAAQGLTNREIGRRAFLTPKSVEDVLRRVYRIVGVRNKTELAARLADWDAPAATTKHA